MAHILLIDVPGGNDFTVLEDAVRMGHQVTFFTSDLEHYQKQGEITLDALNLAKEVVQVNPFSYGDFEEKVLEVHARNPIHAVICIIDIRLVEASQIAHRIGVPFLNLETTRLMRDKFKVRELLQLKGVHQQRFALANGVAELQKAINEVGYPALIKPADGYGSQNVRVLFSESELETYLDDMSAHSATDYGLGVKANNRFSVERYVRGRMIGCDVFSSNGQRVFLGINHKLMFDPPSFAMRGSCFSSDQFDQKAIQKYAYEILDAVNFDFGACHIEMIVAEDGPYLVEVNSRLVSAQIPYQMSYALERSVYCDLINLHLGHSLGAFPAFEHHWFSVIRWFVADREGRFGGVKLPEQPDPQIRRVALFKEEGDFIRPPIVNGDRIGYVIAVGHTQAEAEKLAESYIQNSVICYE
jgi:biotin carboxylase